MKKKLSHSNYYIAEKDERGEHYWDEWTRESNVAYLGAIAMQFVLYQLKKLNQLG